MEIRVAAAPMLVMAVLVVIMVAVEVQAVMLPPITVAVEAVRVA